MLSCFLFTAVFAFKGLETVLTLEPVPEANGFISAPYDVTVDPDGNIYVLDTSASTVFYWNAQGKFMGNIGAKGEGPGELTFFAGSGGPHGYVGVTDSEILLYEANRELSRFDRKKTYQSTLHLQVTPGRINLFKAMGNGGFLVSNSNYGTHPTIVIRLVSSEGKVVKDLLQVSDKSYKLVEKPERTWHFFPYSEKAFATYDDIEKRVIQGRTHEPFIELLDDEGNMQKKIKLEVPRRSFSKEDKTEFLDRRKLSFKHKYFFPDYMPVFTNIIPLAGDRMLVYVQSTNYRKCWGNIVDLQGKPRGRFEVTCGQNGGLFGSRHKIIGIFTGEGKDEDFSIRVLEPRL